MLQIISGKFFTRPDRISAAGKGILFSNYAWVQPIVTRVATLEPVDAYGAVSGYVVSNKNRSSRIWVMPRRATSRTHDRARASGCWDCGNRDLVG
jgi:hypothetical protein